VSILNPCHSTDLIPLIRNAKASITNTPKTAKISNFLNLLAASLILSNSLEFVVFRLEKSRKAILIKNRHGIYIAGEEIHVELFAVDLGGGIILDSCGLFSFFNHRQIIALKRFEGLPHRARVNAVRSTLLGIFIENLIHRPPLDRPPYQPLDS
jgi:hypothetical protein